MTRNVDPQRSKRRLRLHIGRLRRRIDGRAQSLKSEGRRLASWRTYVTQYPAYAVAAALGFGLTASAGLGRGRWTRLLGLHLIRRAGSRSVDALFAELKALWADATPGDSNAKTDGADHGRS